MQGLGHHLRICTVTGTRVKAGNAGVDQSYSKLQSINELLLDKMLEPECKRALLPLLRKTYSKTCQQN